MTALYDTMNAHLFGDADAPHDPAKAMVNAVTGPGEVTHELTTVEAARRIYRALEMSAAIMRDPARTGRWAGAERTASAFERQAIAAKSLHDRLAAFAIRETRNVG